MNFGSLAEWVGAVGTSGGTVVVGLALVHEMRLRRRADNQVATERRDAESRQARLVSVNLTTFLPGRCQLEIINDSDAPVRGLAVVITQADQGNVKRFPADLNASTTVSAYETITAMARFPDGLIGPTDNGVDADVEFTDVNGLRWRITSGTDTLQRVLATD